MRKTTKRLMILMMPVFILALTLGSLACAEQETPQGTPTPRPGAVPTQAHGVIDYAIAAFQMIPVEWQRGRYINLAAFRDDSSLKAFYDESYEDVGQDLAAMGVDMNKVDNVSFVGGRAAVYSGRLDLSSIRQVLENMNYAKSTYLDVEIWKSSAPEMGVVALLPPDSVLVTKEYQDTEMYISVIKGWGSSLYDNEDVKDVTARLSINPLRVDITLDGNPGLLATGSTIEKISNATVAMMTLAKFEDDVTAEKGLSDMTANFNSWANSWNMVSVENVQIRQFVKSTGRAYIEDMDSPLGYSTYWLH
jgi:hypothetical protein